MKVLESKVIDLIEPFPLSQLKRIRGWLYCYRSLMTTDADPKDTNILLEGLGQILQSPNVRSWGIIDKFNSINSRHDAPIVGIIFVERVSPYNSYFHIATNRAAWGAGFSDDAAKMVIKESFDSDPTLLRLSAAILRKNSPAKGLALRVGCEKEGTFKNFILQNGEPLDVVHYGMTRERWNELCQPQPLSQQLPPLEEVSLVDSEPVENNDRS